MGALRGGNPACSAQCLSYRDVHDVVVNRSMNMRISSCRNAHVAPSLPWSSCLCGIDPPVRPRRRSDGWVCWLGASGAYFGEVDHSFRTKSITHFGPKRSLVSDQSDHLFRSKAITHFAPCRSSD